MDKQVEVLDTKPGDLGSVPKTHTLEEEDQLQQLVLGYP